ncbi:NELL2-interacting cell ontogeny regulator 1 [Lithobates pipiens]
MSHPLGFPHCSCLLQQHGSVPKIFIMSYIAAMMTFLGLVTGIFTVTSLAQKVTGSLSEQGTVVPAETRPCVDCHAFEFMERALQDINTAAHNLDTQTEELLLRIEERNLCYCIVQSQELQNSICITNTRNA